MHGARDTYRLGQGAVTVWAVAVSGAGSDNVKQLISVVG